MKETTPLPPSFGDSFFGDAEETNIQVVKIEFLYFPIGDEALL